MDKLFHQTIIDLLQTVSLQILQDYQQLEIPYSKKADGTWATATDMQAEKTIVAALTQLTPDIPIVAEETAGETCERRCQWSTYWCIDPLDGTREFVKRTGDFTINCALIDNHQPILGFIYLPLLQVVYYADAVAKGAWIQFANGGSLPLQTRRLPSKPIAILSRQASFNRAQSRLQALGGCIVTRKGSAAKFCKIAEGRADCYPRIGVTAEWDSAAGQCIVEQAGGAVIQADGQALRYGAQTSLNNPPFLVVGDAEHDWMQYNLGQLLSPN